MRLVNVEAALVAHLEPLLGVQVSTVVPSTRPDAFVVVSRIGGNVANLGVSRVSVLVGCWGSSRTKAWGVVADAWSAVAAIDEPDLVGGLMAVNEVSVAEPVNYPDPVSKSPRYQFIASLTVALPWE